MKHKESKAHLIPEVTWPKIEVADISLRPYRIAFLLDSDLTESELHDLILYNTSIWGGQTNLMIPLKDGIMSIYGWDALLEFDPDIILSTSDIPDAVGERLQKEIQPFSIKQWSGRDAMEHHSIGLDKFNNVPMRFVLSHLYDEIRPIEHTRLRLPIPVADDKATRLSLCAAVQFGVLEDDVHSFMRDVLKAGIVELSANSIDEYLADVESFRGMLHPLKLTCHGLRVKSEGFGGMLLGVVFVLLSQETLVDDLCLFWNLRMRANLVPIATREIIVLPLEVVERGEGADAVAEWFDEHIDACNLITLASVGAGRDRLAKIRNRLHGSLKTETIIDLWWDNFRFHPFRLEHSPQTSEVRIEGSRVTASVPSPKWSDKATSGMEWILDVSLGRRSLIGPGIGFWPPKFDGLNYLIAGEPDWKFWQYMQPSVRVSQGRISLRVKPDQRYFDFVVPDSQKLFHRFIESADYSFKITDKSRYAQGMIRLLGGESGLKHLQDRGLQHLLLEMTKGTRAFRVEEMYSLVMQSRLSTDLSDKSFLNNLIREFAERGVLLRGYWISCPECDLSRWYSLEDISERMECAGCLSTIQPPLEAQFHFRLNELFVRGIQQGSIPLLLTIRFLSSVATESFIYLPGAEVARESQRFDLDALCVCNGSLIIVESKSFLRSLASSTMTEVVGKLRATVEISESLGAEAIVLSTLLDNKPAHLQVELNDLQQDFPRLAIHLLLREDLERGYPVTIVDGKEKMLGLNDLLPDPGPISSGRDIAPGHRKIGVGAGTWTQTVR